MGKVIVAGMFLSAPAFADQSFETKDGTRIDLIVQDPEKDGTEQNRAITKEVCVRSFTTALKDIPLSDLDRNFSSRDDVKRLYEVFSDEDFDLFKEKKVTLVHAFVKDELIGWASFIPEENEKNAFYVASIAISPEYQKKGIGKRLLFSIRDDKTLFPETQTLYLYARKANTNAVAFYKRLGFLEDAKYSRKISIEPSMLVALKWQTKF